MQKQLWFVVGLAGMIAGASAPAAAQYHAYNSWEQDVEVDLSVLDEVEIRKNIDDKTYDTVPPIKPVLQAPLPLTPAGQMRTEASAPVPAAEMPESIPAPPAPSFNETFPVTPPAVRVLKPSAAPPLPESVVRAVNAMPPEPVVEEAAPERIVMPSRPPKNYPSYMTQPETVSKPPARSSRVMMPGHKPSSAPAAGIPFAAETSVREIPVGEIPVGEIPVGEIPSALLSAEDRAEPISLLDKSPPVALTAETAAPEEGREMPVLNVTEQINAPETPAPEAVKDTQKDTQAAVEPSAAVPSIDDLSIEFEGNASEIAGQAQAKLAVIVKQLEGTEGRIQVRAYATGEDGSKSSARRISLSRALAIRSFLMDNGIKPTRVDVRALGSETERSPLDRVDIVFVR